MQIIGNRLSFGCSGDNDAFISLQDGQPIFDISGCVFARIMSHAQVSAKECCGQFGDEFFDRVSVGAEAARQIAIKAMFCARPVTIMPISA